MKGFTTKLVGIVMLLVLISGCRLITPRTVLTGTGIIATTVMGIYKYGSDKKKTEAIIKSRDQIQASLDRIEKRMEAR